MAASLSKEELRKEINAILQNSDLEKTTSKEVRTKLQDKLKVDLTPRKKELDKIIMAAVNEMQSSEESSEGSEPLAPRASASKAKKRKAESSDESDYKPTKSSKKRRSSSDSEDWKETKKKLPKGKYTGFTRPYKLSPELAALMKAKELPRHEVVKKVWAIIKEKNLYDPKNKQYAICDAALEKVIGVKRFRTFGMMKYLSPHLIK